MPFLLFSTQWFLRARSIFAPRLLTVGYTAPRSRHTRSDLCSNRCPGQYSFLRLGQLTMYTTIFCDTLIWWFDLYGGGGNSRGFTLPFHMEGVIIYTGMIGVPILALSCISLGVAQRVTRLIRIGLLCICAHGIVCLLCQASKAAFIDITLTCIVFCGLYPIPATRRRFYLAIAILCITAAISFKVAHEVRVSRHTGIGLLHTVGNILKNESAVSSDDTLPLHTRVLRRVTGADSLLRILDFVEASGRATVEDVVVYGGVVRFYTRVVRGIPESNPTTAAPSLPGSLYLLGGLPMLCVGFYLFLIVFLLIWRGTEAYGGIFASAFLAVLMKICVASFIDGTFDYALPRQLLLWVCFATVVGMNVSANHVRGLDSGG
jgi:hypothetical protein